MSKQITALLSLLKPGHEFPGGSINSRAYQREDVDMLAESISHFGVIQPLVVFEAPEDAGLYVAGGNLRLAALRSLRDRRQIGDDYPVPVVIHKADGKTDPLAVSVEENRVRRALHPVEQYESFVTLKARGTPEKSIGSMFGLKPKAVTQALALGAALCPSVRKAWFDGEITEESAKVFTLVSHERQHDYVTSILKRDRWKLSNANIVRDFLVGNVQKINAYLNFVGDDAYASACGKVIQNLFGDDRAVDDYGLLEKLANEKLIDVRNKLVADNGWSWAEVETNDNRSYRFSLPKTGKGAKSSEADKKESGCIVSLDHNGKLDVVYGLIKGVKKKKRAAAKQKEDATPEISSAMANKIAEQVTHAAAEQVAASPDLALALLVAGFESKSACVRVHSDGLIARASEAEPADFIDTLKALLRLKPTALMKRMAAIVGNSLDFRTGRGVVDLILADDIGAVIGTIDDAAFQKRLRVGFNAIDYFSGITAEQLRDAIREAKGPDALKPLEKASKAKLAEYAGANLPKTGWLPKPLRTALYKVSAK